MFSLRFTIVLLIIIGVPFLIRTRFGDRYEPFPAILLPAGASKVPVLSDKFKVSYTDLIAQKEDGTWDKVDAKLLLYPLPYPSHKFVFEREFGLKNSRERVDGSFSRLLAQLQIIRARVVEEQDQEKTKEWLTERLKNQGFKGTMINIMRKKKLISISSGKVISDEIIDEKLHYLD